MQQRPGPAAWRPRQYVCSLGAGSPRARRPSAGGAKQLSAGAARTIRTGRQDRAGLDVGSPWPHAGGARRRAGARGGAGGREGRAQGRLGRRAGGARGAGGRGGRRGRRAAAPAGAGAPRCSVGARCRLAWVRGCMLCGGGRRAKGAGWCTTRLLLDLPSRPSGRQGRRAAARARGRACASPGACAGLHSAGACAKKISFLIKLEPRAERMRAQAAEAEAAAAAAAAEAQGAPAEAAAVRAEAEAAAAAHAAAQAAAAERAARLARIEGAPPPALRV